MSRLLREGAAHLPHIGAPARRRTWGAGIRLLTGMGLPVRLQRILLRKLGSTLVTDEGFGTR